MVGSTKEKGAKALARPLASQKVGDNHGLVADIAGKCYWNERDGCFPKLDFEFLELEAQRDLHKHGRIIPMTSWDFAPQRQAFFERAKRWNEGRRVESQIPASAHPSNKEDMAGVELLASPCHTTQSSSQFSRARVEAHFDS